MASGSKDSSVFTGNSVGGSPGEISQRKTSGGGNVGGGGKIQTDFPQDNVHGVNLKNTMGGSFGGSDTNLSHSLKGTSAVQKGSGGGGSTEKSGI